jgi:hypothetical protein
MGRVRSGTFHGHDRENVLETKPDRHVCIRSLLEHKEVVEMVKTESTVIMNSKGMPSA